MDIDFLKMHGLGNDFVVLDGRLQSFELTEGNLQWIANRRVGIGCDQILVLEDGQDVFMRIYNADGSEAEACGNGTRCVAWWLARALGKNSVNVQTVAGDLSCIVVGANQVQVEMGIAEVTSSDATDTMDVNIGNPHKVFFVGDIDQVNWQSLMAQAGNDVNVGAAQIINQNQIALRVWERGAGLTLACGSGACAAFAAASAQQRVESSCRVMQPGGALDISQDEAGIIKMTGPVGLSYKGSLNTNSLMS